MRGDWMHEAMQYRDLDRAAQKEAEAKIRQEEIERVLRTAQELRPILLKQYGAVPECVLDFCNRARQALAK